ncbi:MAG: hypothetical protein U0794_23445 [Isosphaeraceae bacterium]
MASLVKSLDSEIAKNEQLKSFVVVLTDQPDATARTLAALAKDGRVKHVPLTLVGDREGPPDYEIDKAADVTVLMWKGAQIKVNRAYRAGELTEAEVPKIIAELPQILGKTK